MTTPTEYVTVIGMASARHGLARGGDIDAVRLEDFLEKQDDVPFRLAHNDPELTAGFVQYAERSSIGLMVVGRVRSDMLTPHGPDDGWRMSIGVSGVRVHSTRVAALTLREIVICRSGTEAGIGLSPCKFSDHNLEHGAGGAPHGLTLMERDVWRRAAVDLDIPSFKRASGIRIHDPDFEQLVTRSRAANAAKPKPRATPPAPVLATAWRGEVLAPGVHRRNSGHIISIDGRPV